jgi:sodium/hydrogen exchanger 8
MGLSLPTLHHTFHIGFITSGMFLICLGRALNIFPLAALINRHHAARGAPGEGSARVKITLKEQFIMWFSGLRGAIAFSLVLTMQSHSMTGVTPETKSVLVTTTLVIVLLTIFIFGGGTAPLLEYVLFTDESKRQVLSNTLATH